MKGFGKAGLVVGAAALGALLLLKGALCARRSNIHPQVADLVQAKQAQVKALVDADQLRISRAAWNLFSYILEDDWKRESNAFVRLQQQSGRGGTNAPRLRQVVADKVQQIQSMFGSSTTRLEALDGPAWHAVMDAHWAYVLSRSWRTPLLNQVCRDMLTNLPPRAVFIGDSDVGRFGVAMLGGSSSKSNGPILMTQNQLTDRSYLEYVRVNCGSALEMPGSDDLEAVFQELVRSNVTWEVGVIQANEALSKLVVSRNWKFNFYIEPSWYVPAWATPRLLPRGPILQICRAPLDSIPDAALDYDQEYWSGWCRRLLGDPIGPSLTISDLCRFVSQIYGRQKLAAFRGDLVYLEDRPAQEWFGMARHASAALYQWRCINATELAEKQRMLERSLIAHQQAFALNPFLALDFADLLCQIGRKQEAILVLTTSLGVGSQHPKAQAMLDQLRKEP